VLRAFEKVRVWLWMLFHHRRATERLNAELEFHLEQQVAENLASGMSREEAMHAAMRTFGNPTVLREQITEEWSWTWVENLLQDVRYALRQLRKSPGFASTAILSLALGIGATVAVFSIIYGALLNPWPYAGADRICFVNLVDKAENYFVPGLTGRQMRVLQQAHAIEDLVGLDGSNLMVTGSDVPEGVAVADLTGNGFQFMGVPAMLGRYFVPSDAPDGHDPQPVVDLSYKFWQRHYGGDPSVIGKTIQLQHKNYNILGVLPPRFTWGDADVYRPLRVLQSQTNRYTTMLKLRQGVSAAAAEAELGPLYQQFDKETPNGYSKGYKLSVRNITYVYIHQLGPTLYLLFGAVALLLAIGCGNVSILLLARGMARHHEFAVRSAVGASSSRIVRQLLTESLILALTGGGLGLLLAYQSVGLIVARLPEYSFPHEADFHVNPPVLLFCIGTAVLTSILFGLFPALQFARPEISQMMQSSSSKVQGSIRGRQLHTALIAGQIALTLLLLTAAGAASEGFLRLMHTPLGYDPSHVMSVTIPIHSDSTEATRVKQAEYFEQLRQNVATMPGVRSAALSTNGTPPWSGWNMSFEILGKTPLEQQEVSVNLVSPEYFGLLHIPLEQGRIWDHTETMHGATLALVNQSFVKRYFPNGDALGHSVRLSQIKSEPPYRVAAPGAGGWLQVIGVVADALDDGLDKPVKPAIFLPCTLWLWQGTQILVRTQGQPLAMVHGVRQRIAQVNADQQTFGEVRDLETWIRQQPVWARGRLISILFGAFSLLALALAAVGLYSVASYGVAQRTSEFGIRIALGARRIDVLKLVLTSAGVSVGAGIAVGLVLSLGMNKLIRQWVHGSAHYPLVLLMVSLLLLVACLLACLLPARRASAVDPMEALRCE
jgi:predicted permease